MRASSSSLTLPSPPADDIPAHQPPGTGAPPAASGPPAAGERWIGRSARVGVGDRASSGPSFAVYLPKDAEALGLDAEGGVELAAKVFEGDGGRQLDDLRLGE